MADDKTPELTPRELATKATLDGIDKMIAKGLLNDWPAIVMAHPELSSEVSTQDFQRMAGEISNGSINAPAKDGKSSITILAADLDALKMQDGSIVHANAVLNASSPMIPSKTHKQLIADAEGQAAEDNTGWVYGASMGNAWAGFKKWAGIEEGDGLGDILMKLIGAFFSDHKVSLTECIATATADNMAEDTKKNLQALKTEHPDMAPMLTDDLIKDAANEAHHAVLEKAKIADPGYAAPPSLANVKGESAQAILTKMHGQMVDEVLHPKGKQALEEQIADQIHKETKELSRFNYKHYASDAAIAKKAKEIAGTAAETIATAVISDDKNNKYGKQLSQLSNSERAQALSGMVGDALVEKGLLNPEQAKEAARDMTRKLLDHSGELAIASTLAGNAPQTDRDAVAKALAEADKVKQNKPDGVGNAQYASTDTKSTPSVPDNLAGVRYMN